MPVRSEHAVFDRLVESNESNFSARDLLGNTRGRRPTPVARAYRGFHDGVFGHPENQAGPLPRVGLYAHIIPSGTYQISGPAEALRVNFRTATAQTPTKAAAGREPAGVLGDALRHAAGRRRRRARRRAPDAHASRTRHRARAVRRRILGLTGWRKSPHHQLSRCAVDSPRPR